MTTKTLPKHLFVTRGGVASIGLGCWAMGGKSWGEQTDEHSRSVLSLALDEGIQHWDTAQAYGGGHSEKLCGEFLSGKRDRVFIATKARMATQKGTLSQRLEASRQRLGVDCIDLFYIHWPHKEGDIAQQIDELERARSAGKIRYIGVSNFNTEQMDRARHAGTIDVHQTNYSLYWREPEKEVLPYCKQYGIAVVSYSSIAQGILTGKFPARPQFQKSDNRPYTFYFRNDVWPIIHATTEKLKSLATEQNRPLLDLSLQWVCAQPTIHSVLVGSKTTKQLREQLDGLKKPLLPDVFDKMTQISDEMIRLLPPYPDHLFDSSH